MADNKKLKGDIKKQAKEERPWMDIDKIKQEFIDWLAQLRFPGNPGAAYWEDCVRVFRSDPKEELPKTGLLVRLALRLYTTENRYLIAIMECLDPESNGVNILTTHVNWKNEEWQMQKTVDEGYTGKFIDMLRPKHTIWAQTIREGELREGLNSCAIAILGNELISEPQTQTSGEPIDPRYPLRTRFPAQVEE